nr:MAG TPA: hypothetical protein [Caudoviricetes sp.]
MWDNRFYGTVGWMQCRIFMTFLVVISLPCT